MATEYVCGKCEGTDWYPAVQVMNSGGANWGTKRVELPTCRKCDITMRKLSSTGSQGIQGNVGGAVIMIIIFLSLGLLLASFLITNF
jgi:hypothetical protein